MGDVSGGGLRPPGGNGNANWGSGGTGGYQPPSGMKAERGQINFIWMEQERDAYAFLRHYNETTWINEQPRDDFSRRSEVGYQPPRDIGETYQQVQGVVDTVSSVFAVGFALVDLYKRRAG